MNAALQYGRLTNYLGRAPPYIEFFAWGASYGNCARNTVIARNRSLRTVSMICLLDNWRMRRIAENVADLRVRAGEIDADIVVPFPTDLSLYEEAAADGFAMLGAWFDGITGDHRA